MTHDVATAAAMVGITRRSFIRLAKKLGLYKPGKHRYTDRDIAIIRKRPKRGHPVTTGWYAKNPKQSPERRRARYLASKEAKNG